MSSQVYGLLGLVDLPPEPIIRTRAPNSSDTAPDIGQTWVNTDSGTVYTLTSLTGGSATWALTSAGGDLDGLAGDSGTDPVVPSGGTITITGGTNITTVGGTNELTLNLDASIALATSVSSPLYTVAAATDLDITSATGKDIVIKLGDAAGVNKLSLTNSADAEIFAVSSLGVITFSGLLITGAFTQTAGAVSISEDNSANAVAIAGGTTARVVDLASSAAAHVVSVGSATGAASLDLKAGTGNFTLDGAATTQYDIGASTTSGTITIGGTAQTGTLTLGDSSGVNIVQIGSGEGATTVNIAGGATAAKVVNLADGAVANLVTIGTVSGAASLDLLCGTGNFTLEGNVASTYDISATGANTGTVTIGAGTGARIVNLATGGTGVKTLNLATGAIGNLVTIGTVSGAASLDLLCGTGNFTLEGATASTYDISSTGVNTGTVTIGAGTGARLVNLATGGTGVKTVNLATGAIGNIVTIGTVTAAASLDLLCGTGNFSLEGNVASTYDISSTGINTGTCTFGAGTGARIVNVGTGGTGIKTVNVGTGAIDNVVTVGSTTGAASLTLQAGTGGITMTGTVQEVTSNFATSTGDSITFTQSPNLTTAATTAGVATGATGDVNIMSLQEGVMMEQFILGAGQTIIGPRMDATGLSVALDQTATEGAEYGFGAPRTNSRHAFTIGTSAAFFFEVEMNITDISAGNPFLIGFRKSEAYNATYTSYTDFYGVGMNSVTSPTNLTLFSELNSGGTTLQDSGTAWTGGDGGTTTMKVLVSAAGVVTATIDGGAPSSPLAFTFDNTDIVCPWITLIQGADLSPVHLVSMKVGLQ